jgi:hypothetical protein
MGQAQYLRPVPSLQFIGILLGKVGGVIAEFCFDRIEKGGFITFQLYENTANWASKLPRKELFMIVTVRRT